MGVHTGVVRRQFHTVHIIHPTRTVDNEILLYVPGDTIHIHSYQSPRVLPPGRRDHSTDISGGAASWEIPDIRHDTRFDKVRVQIDSYTMQSREEVV